MKILKNGEYFGHVKKEIRTDEFILSEYSYHSSRTEWHYHEDPYFMYLLQGQVSDINKKVEERCSSGSLMFHNWDEQHYNAKHSQFARGFHIEVNRRNAAELLTKLIPHKGSILIENPKAHIILSKLYFEFQIQDVFSYIGIESLLINLFDNIVNSEQRMHKSPSWIKELVALLMDDSQLTSLKELSAVLGVHSVHISRSFPKFFGCTLSEYMRMIRIKKSIPLLLAKDNSLTQIAYRCGFADQSHFTNTFKSYMGIPPSKYRIVNQ